MLFHEIARKGQGMVARVKSPFEILRFESFSLAPLRETGFEGFLRNK